MAIDSEDRVDISGQPEEGAHGLTPAEMAKSMHAQTASGHMKQPAESGLDQALGAAGGMAGSGETPEQSQQGTENTAKAIQAQGNYSLLPNWNQRPDQAARQTPVFQALVNDPWYAYQFGRKFFGDLSKIQNAVGQVSAKSIQNQWEQGKANGWTATQVQAESAAVNPIGFLLQELGGVKAHGPAGLNPYYGLSGRKLERSEVATARYAGQQIANPATYLQWMAPESRAGAIALGAYGGLQQLLSSNRVDPQTLLWAGVAGILWSGHIPGGGKVAEALRKVLPSWDQISNHLIERMYESGEAQRLMQSPEGRQQLFESQLQYILENETLKPVTKVLSKASDTDLEHGTYTKNIATGEIGIRPKQDAATLQALLSSNLGVDNIEDLETKLEDGTLSAQESEKLASLIQHNILHLPHDLVYLTEGEEPLRDPGLQLKDVNPANMGAAREASTQLHMLVDHAHRGPVGNDEDPIRSVYRSLIGYNRATSWMHDRLMRSWVKLLGPGAKDSRLQTLLSSAVEGDRTVYDALSPEQKYVVDSYRLIKASTRRAARDAGYELGELPNYLPRLIKRAPGEANAAGDIGSITGDLQGQANKSRRLRAELGIYHPEDDPESERQAIVLRQRYDTIQEANAAVERQRQRWLGQALDPTADTRGMEGQEAVAAIRKALLKDPGEAQRMAEEQAASLFPEFETSFLQIANRSVGRQIAAIQSHQAVDYLHSSQAEIGSAGDGVPRALAQRIKDTDPRQVEQLRRMGYGEAKSAWYKGVLFHPDFLRLLKHSEDLRGSLLSKGSWWSHLGDVEAKLISMIMYFPMIHGLNMAGRFGMLAMDHPMLMAKYITRAGRRGVGDTLKGFINPDDMGRDEESMHLTADAVRAGVMLPDKSNPGSEVLRRLADDVGDDAIAEAPVEMDGSNIKRGLLARGLEQAKRLGRPVASGWDFLNNMLWGNVRDFGVMAYHLEHESLLQQGFGEDASRLLAARRANTWMGMVSPEDTNPLTHDMARLIMFAPNWWRTWAELLTGVYRRSGIRWDSNRVAMQVANDVRVGMAALMWQKLSGNAQNFMMSGHLQEGNQPGNQDQIEIQRPELIRLLQKIGIGQGIDPNTGRNPTTGAVLTMENPFARQQLVTETAAGFESGQPGHKLFKLGPLEVDAPPSINAVEQGSRKEVAARLSPLLDLAAGLGNVDLYDSIAEGQLRHLDPTTDQPSLLGAAMALLSASPIGQNAVYSSQQQQNQQMKQGQNPLRGVRGPFGTTIPEAVKDVVSGFGHDALLSGLTALTGVNAPYAKAEKTAAQGSGPSDAQYRQIDQADATYAQQMNELAAELATGQITPNVWLQEYEEQTAAHSNAVSGLFQGSSSYVNGTDGLLDRYYALENSKAMMTGPGGTFNTDAWLQARSRFMSGLTASQRNALNSAIVRDQQRYPVVGLYEGSVREYESFQTQWAAQNGTSVAQLRATTERYGELYGDAPAAERYLEAHPELQAWEEAKQQWELTPQGMLYGLFEGASTPSMEAYLDPTLVEESEATAQKAENSAA